MSENRGERSARIARMDRAFRKGDMDALLAAAAGEWRIPAGPMPIEIGHCLEYAIYHSPLPFIEQLLKMGADPNPVDHTGFPPLIAAVWQSTRPDVVPLVELLLSFGADPDQRGMNDYTALQVAVIERRPAVVEILLAHGADPQLRTRIDNLESAVELALASGNRLIIALLSGLE